jgi:hypothetical protein
MDDLMVKIPAKLIALQCHKHAPDKRVSLSMFHQLATVLGWSVGSAAAFMGIAQSAVSQWSKGNLESLTYAHQRLIWTYWMAHVQNDAEALRDPLVQISWGRQRHGMPAPIIAAPAGAEFEVIVTDLETRQARGEYINARLTAKKYGLTVPSARRAMREAGFNRPPNFHQRLIKLTPADANLFLSGRADRMLLPACWIQQIGKRLAVQGKDGTPLGHLRFTSYERLWLRELDARHYIKLRWAWLHQRGINPGPGLPRSWKAYFLSLRDGDTPLRRAFLRYQREPLPVAPVASNESHT